MTITDPDAQASLVASGATDIASNVNKDASLAQVVTKDETNSAEVFASGEEAQMVDFYNAYRNDYQPAGAPVIDLQDLDMSNVDALTDEEREQIQREIAAKFDIDDWRDVSIYSESESIFHGKNNIKIGVGEYEYVYNQNGELVTGAYQGTYNYTTNPVGHAIFDIVPWGVLGTGAQRDNFSPVDRALDAIETSQSNSQNQ